MKAEEITNGDMLLAVGVRKMDVEVDIEKLTQAQWVNVNDEMPTQEGFYFILTDEHLAQGIATYFKDEDTGQLEFYVWWAISGKEPKVLYWLKDHHWGLVYDFKKKAKEI